MAKVEIKYDDSQLQEALKAAINAMGNIQPILENMGEYLLNENRERFQKEVGPDGTPWTDLHPQTWAKKKTRKKLQEQGDMGGLLGSINYRADGSTLTLGANKVYAAILHFGGQTRPHLIKPKNKKALAWPGGKHPVSVVHHPGSKFPPRPFLGISEDDNQALIDIISDYVGFGGNLGG